MRPLPLLWVGLVLFLGCGVTRAIGHAIECTVGPDNDQYCRANSVAPPPGAPYQATFADSEYAPYQSPGTASVAGTAVLRGPEPLIGPVVVLKPVTSLSREWWRRTVTGGEAGLYSPSPWQQYDHESRSDSSGRFRFDSLAPGEYFLASFVVGRRGHTARWIGARVHLHPDAQESVDLVPIK